jgi:hypothetical protein
MALKRDSLNYIPMQKIWPILMLLCSDRLQAQDNFVQRIVDAPVLRLPLYKKLQQPGIIAIPFHCAYAAPIVSAADGIKGFDSLQVLAIDLVYTDYPARLDLKALNTRRLNNLLALLPQLKTMPNIEWRLVRQMEGAEKPAAQQLFHGFMVYARPLQTKQAMRTDSSRLADMLTPKPLVRPKHNGFIATDTSRLREIYEIEPYTIIQKMPVKAALRYLNMDAKLIAKYTGFDSVLVFEKPTDDSTETVLQRSPPDDSTVIKVLDRKGWRQMLMVTDVTASMYPYTGQLLFWLQLNDTERPIHQFVFFNDGDRKEESEKVLGRTGGIYTTASSDFEAVEKLLFATMGKGSGGAIPENNIEALLYGLSACPQCKEVVLIADNHSPVADMALLPQLGKPVRIIACGVLGKINPDLLTVARQTGGSVHLAETDLERLAALQEGAVLTVGSYRYKVKDGGFVVMGE